MYRLLFLLILSIVTLMTAAPYKELLPNFSCLRSKVMVRKIDIPTMANLDFSAYDKNPVLIENFKKLKLSKKPGEVIIDTISFENTILEIKNNLHETPLTQEELKHPLAWKPLVKRLWTIVKDDNFQAISSKVSSFKWNDPQVFLPYQQISTMYLHKNGNFTEFWVKIDFSPWVKFIKNISDEDQDGFREIYGRLNPDSLDKNTLQTVSDWITLDYCIKILSHDEMVDWITDLASYWYPTKNTDILDLSDEKKWPLKTTARRIVKELYGLVIDNPLAIIEGKPFSPKDPIYNVFITAELQDTMPQLLTTSPINIVKGILDTSKSQNFINNQIRFEEELKKHGTYESWNKDCISIQEKIREISSSIPSEQMGIEGKDGWLFFLKSLQYLLGGDITSQITEKNPLPHLQSFKEFLDNQNINLLFVAIPNKEEVYFDKLLSDSIAIPGDQIVNPFSRKILKDIQNAGIEVIDLLPSFLKAKAEDSLYNEAIYQKQDTHWSYRGLQIAADLISDRIKQYSWFISYKDKQEYVMVDATFQRSGDIVDRLPESKKVNYHPINLQAKQVRTPDGALYKSLNSSAPIMLIGDSFTGVYESVDCKSAGVGAHIAANTGLPVDIITSWGGGPLVRKKAMKARQNDLGNKKLVIYMMVARDMYNYSQNWEPFPEK